MMPTSSFRSLPSLNSMSFALHRLNKRIGMVVSTTTDWALFIGIILILGLGSSWYMVERGSMLTTLTVGPWVSWTSAGRPDADPYTRAHEARLGILPLNADVAQTFTARADGEGRTLHSSCDYAVEGPEIPGYWWSLTVFDADGRLIPNTLGRFTYTSDTMAVRADGRYVAKLSRDTQAGNWLPVGGAGRLALAFTAIDLGTRAVTQDGEIAQFVPTITRVRC